MKTPFTNRMARMLLSYLPKLGLLPGPSRPAGISAMLRVWDERDTIEASIASIQDTVDEIVAVDTGSTDGTWELLEKMSRTVKNLNIFRCETGVPWDFSNFALARTRYRWILKWDGDFLSQAGDRNGVSRLKERILGLDKDRFYYINPALIEVAGDFHHQFPSFRSRNDIELFTYSEDLKYVPVDRVLRRDEFPVKLSGMYAAEMIPVKIEALKIPFFYRIMEFNDVIGFHVNVKSRIRHLLGYFHLQWLGSEDFGKFRSVTAYAEDFVKTRWGFKDLDSAAVFYMKEYAGSLVPYDEKLGELPDNLKTLAQRSPYRIVRGPDGKADRSG